jgi:hypothetical protein
MKRNDVIALVLLALGWSGLIGVVGLGPEVALEDSWNYAQMTRRLLETGELRFSHFDSALVVLHILWGAAVTKVIGFSLTHCIAANLLAAFLALVAVYWLVRQFDLPPSRAALVTAATGLSPPFFVTAFTYMADFWFLIPAWASVAAGLAYLRTKRIAHLWLAAALAAVSLWNRAHGVLLPVALAVVLLVHAKRFGKRWSLLAVAFALPALSWVALQLAVPALQPVRTTFERKSAEVLDRLADPVILLGDGAFRLAVLVLCLGAYAVPLLPLMFRGISQKRRFWTLAAFGLAGVGAAAVWLIAGKGQLFPFAGSVLRKWPPVAHEGLLLAWTAISVSGALGLVFGWARALPAEDAGRDSALHLAVANILFQAAPLVLLVYFLDRYFLVLAPLALAVAVRAWPPAPGRRHQAVVVAWAIGCLSVAALASGARVIQYRNGVDAQWRAADELIAQGVDPMSIDGGYPCVGWRNFETCLSRLGENNLTPLDTPYVGEICPAMRVRYDVVFHPMPPPRQLLRERTYENLGLDAGRVYVYERLNLPE